MNKLSQIKAPLKKIGLIAIYILKPVIFCIRMVKKHRNELSFLFIATISIAGYFGITIPLQTLLAVVVTLGVGLIFVKLCCNYLIDYTTRGRLRNENRELEKEIKDLQSKIEDKIEKKVTSISPNNITTAAVKTKSLSLTSCLKFIFVDTPSFLYNVMGNSTAAFVVAETAILMLKKLLVNNLALTITLNNPLFLGGLSALFFVIITADDYIYKKHDTMGIKSFREKNKELKQQLETSKKHLCDLNTSEFKTLLEVADAIQDKRSPLASLTASVEPGKTPALTILFKAGLLQQLTAVKPTVAAEVSSALQKGLAAAS